jgi:hypothetical protein
MNGKRKDVSNLLGISERRVSQLVLENVLPRPKAGAYDLVGCVRGYVDSLRQQKGSLTEERVGLTRAKRLKAELDLRQREGELLEKFSVEQQAFENARQVRDRLNLIPDRIAAVASAESDQTKNYATILKEIHQALEELGEQARRE